MHVCRTITITLTFGGKRNTLWLCLGWYGQVSHTSTRLCCHPVDNNDNYVRLWDKLTCLLNFASMFIYSVLQMLACPLWYLVPNNHHNNVMKLIKFSHDNQPFIMSRAIWRHVRGHTDSLTHTLTHTHTHKPPTAGAQLVAHTSIINNL